MEFPLEMISEFQNELDSYCSNCNYYFSCEILDVKNQQESNSQALSTRRHHSHSFKVRSDG